MAFLTLVEVLDAASLSVCSNPCSQPRCGDWAALIFLWPPEGWQWWWQHGRAATRGVETACWECWAGGVKCLIQSALCPVTVVTAAPAWLLQVPTTLQAWVRSLVGWVLGKQGQFSLSTARGNPVSGQAQLIWCLIPHQRVVGGKDGPVCLLTCPLYLLLERKSWLRLKKKKTKLQPLLQPQWRFLPSPETNVLALLVGTCCSPV